MHKAALQIWEDRLDYAVILCTVYESGDDKIKEWIDADSDYDPDFEQETRWWRILNDASLFSLGVGL